MLRLKYVLMIVGVTLVGMFCMSFGSMQSHAAQNNVYDLSEWQGKFTDDQVKKLKDEVPFVILRVQFGSAYYDKTFDNNVALMKKYNVPYGVYSFSQYTDPNDAADEAKALYNRAPDAKFYVNDYEQQTVKSGGTNESTLAWINALRPLVGNRKILFYSYQSFMLNHAAEAISAYDGYWLAAYQTNEPQREHVLWQYTDHYYSPALGQYVDSSLLTVKNSDWFIGNTAPKSNAKYEKVNGIFTVRSGATDNFYNHVVGDNKYASKLKVNNEVANYKGKTISYNMKATVNNETYYRTYFDGHLLGWINVKALGPHITYSRINMTKQIKAKNYYNFYNHVVDSHFANTHKLVNGSKYAGKRVHITGRAIKDGWHSYYYKCYYEGKFIGWIYQRAF